MMERQECYYIRVNVFIIFDLQDMLNCMQLNGRLTSKYVSSKHSQSGKTRTRDHFKLMHIVDMYSQKLKKNTAKTENLCIMCYEIRVCHK